MTEMNIMQVMNYIGDKIPSDSAYTFRQRLASLPDSAAPYFYSVPLHDTTTVIIVSVFLGGLGIDRFIIGDVGMGIAKLLLLNWLTCGIFPIVDIFLCYKRAKRKNFEKLMQAVPAQQPLRS